MKRIVAPTLAVLVALSAVATIAQTPTTGNDLLPTGTGHDTMVKVCSSCHAPAIAARQRHDRAGWREVVESMASRGAMVSDKELDEIVDYLTARFPTAPPPPAK